MTFAQCVCLYRLGGFNSTHKIVYYLTPSLTCVVAVFYASVKAALFLKRGPIEAKDLIHCKVSQREEIERTLCYITTHILMKMQTPGSPLYTVPEAVLLFGTSS